MASQVDHIYRRAARMYASGTMPVGYDAGYRAPEEVQALAMLTQAAASIIGMGSIGLVPMVDASEPDPPTGRVVVTIDGDHRDLVIAWQPACDIAMSWGGDVTRWLHSTDIPIDSADWCRLMDIIEAA